MSKNTKWATIIGIIVGIGLLTSGISHLFSLYWVSGISVLLLSILMKISIGLFVLVATSLMGSRCLIADLEKRVELLEKSKESR